jgi:hypothetical protein
MHGSEISLWRKLPKELTVVLVAGHSAVTEVVELTDGKQIVLIS